MAGLNAAHVLKKAGIIAPVYTGEGRLGGRVATATGLVGPGLVTELGGEFIDSSHDDVLALADEFDLELLDLLGRGEDQLETSYFFGGAHYSEAHVVEAFRPLARRIAADQAGLGFPITARNIAPHAARLDQTSLGQYLDDHAGSPLIRDLIDAAYVGEYGLDSDEQSSLNLLTQISPDVSQGFQLYGDSDERYKVAGGNGRLIDALARALPGQVALGQTLASLRPQGSAYALTFVQPGGPTREVMADFVILAIPFSILREIDLQVPLPDAKRQAITELGYGTNTKLLLGVRRRFWRDRGLDGSAYSDRPFQETYDNSELLPGTAGGLTVFLGGREGLAAGAGTAAHQVGRHLADLNALFPGLAGQLVGRFARAYWPGAPFVRGSYACYRPGQYAAIAGEEARPVGRLFFAGEHCSLRFQGYINGAAETGRRAAEAVLARLGLAVPG
jgi:monoamine oxidase